MKYKELVILFILLFLPVGIVRADVTYNKMNINLLSSGDAIVITSFNVTNAPTVINVSTFNAPYLAEAYTVNGNEVPVNFTNSTIHVYVLENGTITVRYITQIAYRNGRIWFVNISSDKPIEILLPDSAVPIYIGKEPINAEYINNRLKLEFPPGSVYLEYVLYFELPQLTSTLSTTSGMNTPFSKTITKSSTTSGQSQASSMTTIIYGVSGVIASIVIVIGLLFLRRKNSDIPETIIDERDKQILDAIKSLGAATASDIMSKTGIPKTPLYRRLKKLMDLGLIEEIGKKNKMYKLKK